MLAALGSRAQETSPNDKLLAARVLYYTPTAQGLDSFHCRLQPDWKGLLAQFSDKPVRDADPYLRFLSSVHLAVSDDLHGQGQLEWSEWSRPPPRYVDAAAKMRYGMQETLSGFFTLWNAYMNGTMLPSRDGTTLIQNRAGLHLQARTEDKELSETFDANMLLTEVHLTQPSGDVTAYPKYVDTPDGRLVAAVRMEVHQPPASRAMDLTLHITYAAVSNFRLPETLQYDLRGVGVYVFKFSDCTVRTAETAARR